MSDIVSSASWWPKQRRNGGLFRGLLAQNGSRRARENSLSLRTVSLRLGRRKRVWNVTVAVTDDRAFAVLDSETASVACANGGGDPGETRTALKSVRLRSGSPFSRNSALASTSRNRLVSSAQPGDAIAFPQVRRPLRPSGDRRRALRGRKMSKKASRFADEGLAAVASGDLFFAHTARDKAWDKAT